MPAGFLMAPEGNGYFSALVPGASTGTLYRYRLGGGNDLFPTPPPGFSRGGLTGPRRW